MLADCLRGTNTSGAIFATDLPLDSYNEDWEDFPEKVAIQLNDTHPAIAVVELQRLLHDEYAMPWDKAWSIVTRTFAYTNHTLLPEALEKWSVGLFQKVVPRHLQLIFEINKRFLEQVDAKWPGDTKMKQHLSLIEEGSMQMVRMAHLAVVGGHSVNGVALHTKILQRPRHQRICARYLEFGSYPHLGSKC